ncbi:MAG: putative bacteriocin export ABC transporter [Oscillospiraceae bacterium]|nr:putative bacteriocin export ABC transporter [Oscillospiraceae bacterium]
MQDIKLTNICKKYGDNAVLNNFSLDIAAGDYISITGESGKGKTTILNIIGMLDAPNRGTVEICGCKNPKFSSREATRLRRYDVSYLFQNYGLIDTETVEKNLAIVLRFKKISRTAKKRFIANALAQVGLQGYEKRKIFTLSGGEQQRVALAKIIVKSPKIILADEPTGSLDEKNRNYVLGILNELNKEGKTVIVVTHDAFVASCAKRNIHL